MINEARLDMSEEDIFDFVVHHHHEEHHGCTKESYINKYMGFLSSGLYCNEMIFKLSKQLKSKLEKVHTNHRQTQEDSDCVSTGAGPTNCYL